MAKKITKPMRPAARKPRKRRRLTPDGRRRMAKAGAANLAAYREREAAAKAKAGQDVEAQLGRFERDLFSDLGGDLSAAERALVASARASYGAILLATTQLLLAPGRLARKRGLSAALCAHQNALLRALKALGLKRRASEAPTLDQVFEQIEREKVDGKKN